VRQTRTILANRNVTSREFPLARLEFLLHYLCLGAAATTAATSIVSIAVDDSHRQR
jgi:hypothetical protein